MHKVAPATAPAKPSEMEQPKGRACFKCERRDFRLESLVMAGHSS